MTNIFFDLLKSIYNKNKIKLEEFDNSLLIGLSRTLSKDKENLNSIKKIIDYLFWIEPIHYFYLLYFHIPKKFRFSFIKTKKEEKKENKLLNEIKNILNWSKREFIFNENILEKVILPNKKYWKEQLGMR